MKKRSNLRQCRSDKGRKVNSSQWMARFYLLIIKMNMKLYLLLFYRIKKPKRTRDPWIESIEDWGVSRGTISRFLDHYFSKILAPVEIDPMSLMCCSYGQCLQWHERCFECCFHVQYNVLFNLFSLWRTYIPHFHKASSIASLEPEPSFKPVLCLSKPKAPAPNQEKRFLSSNKTLLG